ncbi:MAG: hypothetical protein GTO24_15440 [candidate division Zixibacteria bacterium]|nr:hypothetical protein [candidate division Zixibacteria bacterium]
MTKEQGNKFDKEEVINKVTEFIENIIADIPLSKEKPSDDPEKRCRELISSAALRAAAVSGSLAIPPAAIGLLTILPDLVAIWRIQAQLVSDIAAAFDKGGDLDQRVMIYCLFRHAAAQALRDILIRVGNRLIVKRSSLRVIQRILRQIGFKITQRIAGRAASRWLPIVGAVGVAAYAYFDTAHVGKTAVNTFKKEIEFEGPKIAEKRHMVLVPQGAPVG